MYEKNHRGLEDITDDIQTYRLDKKRDETIDGHSVEVANKSHKLHNNSEHISYISYHDPFDCDYCKEHIGDDDEDKD